MTEFITNLACVLYGAGFLLWLGLLDRILNPKTSVTRMFGKRTKK